MVGQKILSGLFFSGKWSFQLNVLKKYLKFYFLVDS